MKYDNKDLSYIDKHFGEKMAHFCRDNFSTILEQPGVLAEIFATTFVPTKSIYEDIINENKEVSFKDFIYTIFHDKYKKNSTTINDAAITSPKKMMDEAGYVLFPECQTEKDILEFKKYWTPDEELCTFRDPANRLKKCRVWFAIKKGVLDGDPQYDRKNFAHPVREDSYGTSAISIQIDKDSRGYISIKNRYNHTVMNPDCTYSNNLDNIIPGLTQAFKIEFGIENIQQNCGDHNLLDLNYYVLAPNRKYYRFNVLERDITTARYFCEHNNIIVENEACLCPDPARYLLLDQYIFDKQQGCFLTFHNRGSVVMESISGISSNFVCSLPQKIDRYEITKNQDGTNTLCLYSTAEDGTPNPTIKIFYNKYNQIVGIINPYATYLPRCFMADSCNLRFVEFENVQNVGESALKHCFYLKKLYMPNVKYIGELALYNLGDVETLDMPLLHDTADAVFSRCLHLKKVNLPNLQSVGDLFMILSSMKELNLPSLQSAGRGLLGSNRQLESFVAPNCTKIGPSFLYENTELKYLQISEFAYIDTSTSLTNHPNTNVIFKKMT